MIKKGFPNIEKVVLVSQEHARRVCLHNPEEFVIEFKNTFLKILLELCEDQVKESKQKGEEVLDFCRFLPSFECNGVVEIGFEFNINHTIGRYLTHAVVVGRIRRGYVESLN